MSLRTALKVIAVLSAVFGVGFVIVPGLVFGPYGVQLDAAGAFVARLFGAANIGFAVATWFASDGDTEVQWGLAFGVVAYSLVEGAVTAGAMAAHIANALAFGFIVLDVVFIGACLTLMRPRPARV